MILAVAICAPRKPHVEGTKPCCKYTFIIIIKMMASTVCLKPVKCSSFFIRYDFCETDAVYDLSLE